VQLLDAILQKPLRQQDLLDCLLRLFTVPGEAAAPQMPEKMPAEPVARPAIKQGLSLLLVEDNKINQQFALALLMKAGHNVEVADNGHKAVDAARKREYDAVLMDIQMPELDGIEATKQIRALPPPFCNAYIIAMTANAMAGAREQYVGAGMNDYLSKPIDAADLLTRLARLPARVSSEKPAPAKPKVTLVSLLPPVADSGLDHNKLGELLRYLPLSSVTDLINLFVAESGGHMMRIKSYLAADDHAALAREAHILVGTAGNIGAMAVSATARALETACRDNKGGVDIGRMVAELDLGLARGNAAFLSWIATQAPRKAAG